MQRDLDRFLRYYNLERSHQGYRLKGRTSVQALIEALGLTEIPDIVPRRRSPSRWQRLLRHAPETRTVG